VPTKKIGPSKHPYPPADINKRVLPFSKCKGPWFRLHRRALDPLFFNRGNNYRFNAPGGEFGVLYLSYDEPGAFIETYGWNTGRKKAVSQSALHNRLLAKVKSKIEFNLVDITGKGLARIGADARLCSGENYQMCQKWSLALWNHPSHPHGIKYTLRHDQSKIGVALYSRSIVSKSLSAIDLGTLLAPHNLSILTEILDQYDFGLI
jgi:hypothetical protein